MRWPDERSLPCSTLRRAAGPGDLRRGDPGRGLGRRSSGSAARARWCSRRRRACRGSRAAGGETRRALAAGVLRRRGRCTRRVAVDGEARRGLRDVGADCVVSLGGGSTIGLGKAIAVRTDADQVAVPATYAGSEMTDILGETDAGRKTTRRDPPILPETVIYDVELTLGAAAGADRDLGPERDGACGRSALCAGPQPGADADGARGDRRARHGAAGAGRRRRRSRRRGSRALYGAWLCGAALGGTTMGAAPQALPCARRQLRPAALRRRTR